LEPASWVNRSQRICEGIYRIFSINSTGELIFQLGWGIILGKGIIRVLAFERAVGYLRVGGIIVSTQL